MILIDANLLLYAYDSESPHNERASAWLARALTNEPDVRVGIATILAFMRLATDQRVFAQPLAPDDAARIVSTWLSRDNVALAIPADGHWARLGTIASAARARGPLLMDAHLAALAVEHGATLATSDRDFTRFRGLKTINPLDSPL